MLLPRSGKPFDRIREIQYSNHTVVQSCLRRKAVTMLILPQSNPLYQQIPSHHINLPDVLNKMGSGGFSGYLGYASTTVEAYVLFAKGALIDALLVKHEQRKIGFEALNDLFDAVLIGDGFLNVYRMTVDVVMCTHALLCGDQILQPQEVRTVDLKALLERMKLQSLNGTVLFSAPQHSAMIFYKEGMPVGFYHDAAREIETSPQAFQKVAALPDATVQILSSQPVSDLVLHNLLEMVNINKLWEAAQTRSAGKTAATAQETTGNTADHSAQLAEIVDDVREIATAYLSHQGATLVERLLAEGGGSALLADGARRADFLAAITAQSLSIDPEAKVDEMVDLMQSEIAGRLSV